MRLAVFAIAEDPRTIQHDVDTQFAPWKCIECSLMQNADSVIANDELVTFLTNIPGKTSMAGVIFQQMRHACSIRKFVDCHHGDFRPTPGFIQSTNHVASDATETINRYAYGHRSPARISQKRCGRQSNAANRSGKPYLSQTATNWLIVEHLID